MSSGTMSSGHSTLVAEKSAIADALDPTLDRKDQPPPFSDLIVVNQGDKYMVPPPEPNRDQEKNLAEESSVERRHRKSITLKVALLIGVVVLIVLVAVIGAIAGTVWRKHKDGQSSQSDGPPASAIATSPAGVVHNMSGTATATAGYIYPTAVSPEPTIIHVFGVGGNASLYVKTQNTATDPTASNGNWSTLGGTITPGVISAVSRGVGSVNTFSRGTNGGLYHKYLTNGTTWGPDLYGWDDRKGSLQSLAPEVISWGENRLDVFTIGDGNGLNTLTWNSTNLADWGNWLPLGGQWSKQIMPTLVSWAKGRLDVFLVHPRNGMMYHRFLDPNATNWQPFYGFESLGGQLAGRPSALSLGFGRIDVFARGKDGGLWHVNLDNSGNWSDWVWRGADIRGEPAVVSCGRNRIDVFVWGEDFKYYYKSFDGTKWIPEEGFAPLGNALFGGPPKVLSRTEGMIDLFGYSNHGSVMHKAWSKADGGWAPDKPFDNWGTPG